MLYNKKLWIAISVEFKFRKTKILIREILQKEEQVKLFHLFSINHYEIQRNIITIEI